MTIHYEHTTTTTYKDRLPSPNVRICGGAIGLEKGSTSSCHLTQLGLVHMQTV